MTPPEFNRARAQQRTIVRMITRHMPIAAFKFGLAATLRLNTADNDNEDGGRAA